MFETGGFKEGLAAFLRHLHEAVPEATFYGEYVGDAPITGTYLPNGCGSFGFPAPIETKAAVEIDDWNDLPEEKRDEALGYLTAICDEHLGEPGWLWTLGAKSEGHPWEALPVINTTLIDKESAKTLIQTYDAVSQMIPEASIIGHMVVGLAGEAGVNDLFDAELESMRPVQSAVGVREIDFWSPPGIAGVSWIEAVRATRKKERPSIYRTEAFEKSLAEAEERLRGKLPAVFKAKKRKGKGLTYPKAGEKMELRTDITAKGTLRNENASGKAFKVALRNANDKPIGQLVLPFEEEMDFCLCLGCLVAFVAEEDPLSVVIDWKPGASAAAWHDGSAVPVLKYAGKNPQTSICDYATIDKYEKAFPSRALLDAV